MRVAITTAVVATMLAGISAAAQQDNDGAPANDQGKVTYAATAGGYGDLAASHAYEMSVVTCELDGKLDSRTAKVGDRVVMKTADKVITADGTQIPRGTLFLGHVTEVGPYDPDRGPGRIAIALDQAELKKGQNIAIYTLIRNLRPARAMNSMPGSDNSVIGMPVSMGAQVNGGRMSPDYGTVATASETGAVANRADRNGEDSAVERSRADTGSGGIEPVVQTNSGVGATMGAHELAAARAVPHPTNYPGVMLAGNSTSSGVLLAPVADIHFDSGTMFLVGVAR
ncbi:MAG TPA: hypothetical protein VMT38_09560 [Terracidiphilus sp.]|nr:hypothetical protein [Terracidiphilus sp.]